MDQPAAETPAPDPRPPFRDLLHRVLEGSEEAARQLQEQYADPIMHAVRRRLPQRLRPRFDSMDFVQDVWASFFRTPDRAFESPEHLVAYLIRMAQNKVVDATRSDLTAEKRGLAHQEPLPEQEDDQPHAQPLYARDDTPSQAAISAETWAQLLEGQPPAYRVVLLLLRDGATQQEVAEQLQLSVKTVRRILQRAFERMQL